MRIVSLLPSATEICHYLGILDEVVGVSHDCDWPPDIEDRPALSSTTIEEEASSGDIDQQVSEQMHAGRSLYHLNRDRLDDLAPDLILTQELCEVCAPAFDQVEEAARVMKGKTDVISLEPESLDDVLANIRTVAERTGTEERAEELIEHRKHIRREIEERVRDRNIKPRVLDLEWLDPPYIGGHWVPEMVEVADGQTMNDPGENACRVDWTDITAFDPEIAILMPCGFDTDRTRAEYDVLEERDEWNDLRAVHSGRVYNTHGSYYFNRPGPRLFTGLKILAKCMHPKRFRDFQLPEDALDTDPPFANPRSP